MTVTVCLSVEDVTAVLVAANATYAEELPDDESLRALVAGAVLNNGCLEIEDWRAGPRAALGVGPGDEFEQYVRACHARAAEVFTGVVSHG